MNLKDYAKSRKLTLKQAQDLCRLVLEEVPLALTQENIAGLDEAAAAAAQQLAALPAGEEAIASSPAPLVSNAPAQPVTSQTRKVIAALGEDTLRQNIALFMTSRITQLQQIHATHQAILTKFEADINYQTNAMFERLAQSAQLPSGSQIEPLSEADQAYQDYLGLLDSYLSRE